MDANGNRHCNKCQSLARAKWLEKHRAQLLPVPYYLGRYTHRVAISNERLIRLQDGRVTFRWKDYKQPNKQKLMTLEAGEFIRRYLIHVLPRGFVRIRHFGWLANTHREQKLALCRKLLGIEPPEQQREAAAENADTSSAGLTGESLAICPACRQGHMVVIEIIHPMRAPYRPTPATDSS